MFESVAEVVSTFGKIRLSESRDEERFSRLHEADEKSR